MPFEGGSNSTYTKDYSGNSNDGTVNGSTWSSTAGHDNKGAYQFDELTDYIEIDTTGFKTGNMTFTAWAYVEEFSGHNYVFGHTTQPSFNNPFCSKPTPKPNNTNLKYNRWK